MRKFRSVKMLGALALGLSAAVAIPVGLVPALSAGAQSAAPSVFVTNSKGNSVSVIDSATNAVTATVHVGSGPLGAAITPNGHFVYVSNHGSNNVSVINAATNTVVATVAVGLQPIGTAIAPNGQDVYVANHGLNNVSEIATATNTVVATVPVGSGPFPVAINPNGQQVYVAGTESHEMSVIATATNTVVATVKLPKSDPHWIAVAPSGQTAYVANDIVNGASTINVVNLATDKVTSTFTNGSAAENHFEGMAISNDGTTAYVSDHHICTVSVINLATQTVTATIPVGDHPESVALSPDGSEAFVNNSGPNAGAQCSTNENTTSVIDTATDTLVANIPVGVEPQRGLAVTPDQAPVASLSVTPAPHGSPTSFNASASTVEFGTISSYAWNFGDGHTATTPTPTTTHTYASAGSYTASVTETDSAGTSTTQVFTGQEPSLNGGPSATTSKTFSIS
jgi:YVTN family beta-propeller protein